MQELALILHFIGLAMGLGTSFAFMFLGIKSSKMEEQERLSFQLNTLALSRMGQIGLLLLVTSGLYLMGPYWEVLSETPLLIAKLILFLVLVILIGIISSAGKKAEKGDPKVHLSKTESLGKISFLTAITIVILAVFIFH